MFDGQIERFPPGGPRLDLLGLLADRLDLLAPERFNIEVWKCTKSCGTVVCAAGYACEIAEFQRVGLSMVMGVPTYHPAGMRKTVGFLAISQCFCIPFKTAYYLFKASAYRNLYPDMHREDYQRNIRQLVVPRTVANRIREFIRLTQEQSCLTVK